MGKSYKILAVDDNPSILRLVQMNLQMAGYQVITAADGTEALEKVKKEKPDLLLLDVMMRDMAEGFQVVQTLRSKAPDSEYAAYVDIPIIMVTAAQEKMKLKFHEIAGTEALPVQGYIEKPVDPRELLQQVEKVLKDGEAKTGGV